MRKNCSSDHITLFPLFWQTSRPLVNSWTNHFCRGFYIKDTYIRRSGPSVRYTFIKNFQICLETPQLIFLEIRKWVYGPFLFPTQETQKNGHASLVKFFSRPTLFYALVCPTTSERERKKPICTVTFNTMGRDIHIECSKQFKFNSYFYMSGQNISLKSERKTHDLNHDLTFSAHTINCVCHSIRSMFRVLGIYNFDHQ